MIEGLITLLIIALVLGLIFWAIDWMGIPQPFNKGLKAVLVLVGLIVLINFLLSLTGHGGFIRWK
jgi:multisubunit Na+/H+ antiporter MnhB subunit